MEVSLIDKTSFYSYRATRNCNYMAITTDQAHIEAKIMSGVIM